MSKISEVSRLPRKYGVRGNKKLEYISSYKPVVICFRAPLMRRCKTKFPTIYLIYLPK